MCELYQIIRREALGLGGELPHLVVADLRRVVSRRWDWLLLGGVL